jgi:hypothetical protein
MGGWRGRGWEERLGEKQRADSRRRGKVETGRGPTRWEEGRRKGPRRRTGEWARNWVSGCGTSKASSQLAGASAARSLPGPQKVWRPVVGSQLLKRTLGPMSRTGWRRCCFPLPFEPQANGSSCLLCCWTPRGPAQGEFSLLIRDRTASFGSTQERVWVGKMLAGDESKEAKTEGGIPTDSANLSSCAAKCSVAGDDTFAQTSRCCHESSAILKLEY